VRTRLRRQLGLAGWLGRPKTTVRWRLTLLYGGLFLVCGAALLAITYTLVDHATVTKSPFRTFVDTGGPPPAASRPSFQRAPAKGLARQPTESLPGPIQKLLKTASGRRAVFTLGSVQRISDLHQLVIESSIALAIMAIISAALGWVVAGRVLAPLRTMTAATQQISETNLHERLAMAGPPDELRQLADTIDGLLGRLEGAFDAQRRFVANASHELRTPLTAVRALLEMVLSDPRATVGTFRTICRQVLEESEQQEELIDALLALAQGQRGVDSRERIDLAAIVGDVIRAQEGRATGRGIHVDASLEPVAIAGDRRLIGRLVSNLVDNALRYNIPGGTARIVVRAEASDVDLAVINTGPVVPAAEVDRLLQPFQRLAGARVGHGESLGLGLSIVAAIANAHNAALEVKPGAHGGLEVNARFARAPEGDGVAVTPRDARGVEVGLAET
jgi:signal transduction histidine kinase